MVNSSFGFLRKVGRKIGWEFRSRTNQRYKVEVIHQRANQNYPDFWPKTEFVHRITGPVYIEPKQGWIVTDDGVLIEESLYPQHLYKSAWRNGLPPLNLLDVIKENALQTIELDEVTSLRFPWEYNYYHFHVDVLGKLNLLRQVGVPVSASVALGRYVRLLPFPREILSRGSLSRYQFIMPDINDIGFVRAEVAYYCRTLQKYRTRMDYVLDLMDVPIQVEAAYTGDAGRRVFVTRRPPNDRLLANSDEVEALVARYGFETIDANDLDVAGQISLFGGTRYLIGLHGAGLVNIIYRRAAPLSVLELHAEGYITSDFLYLSAEYGYTHHRLSGMPVTGSNMQHANFTIDIPKLESALRKMLCDG